MNNNILLYSGMGFGALGLIIIIFKKSIGKIYDKMNLTDKEKKHYKNTVVPLGGIILIIASIIMLALYFLNDEMKNHLVDFIENYKYIFPFILGIIAAGYGIFTIVIRIMKKEDKFFVKYEAMKRQYGNAAGTIIHILGYTVVPLAVGIYFIIKYFGKIF